MPQTIRLSAPDEEHSLSLSPIDKRLFSVVAERVLPMKRSLLQKVVWWASDFWPPCVHRYALLKEVRAAGREIERDSELLHYVYAHSARFTDRDGNVFQTSGSGGSSGYQLADDPGHFYSIDTGFGLCDLKRLAVDENGMGVLLETKDCRLLKTIETINTGPVIIKKRKIKSNLGKSFSDLQTFLERHTVTEIGIAQGEL